MESLRFISHLFFLAGFSSYIVAILIYIITKATKIKNEYLDIFIWLILGNACSFMDAALKGNIISTIFNFSITVVVIIMYKSLKLKSLN